MSIAARGQKIDSSRCHRTRFVCFDVIWVSHKNPVLIFPARGREGNKGSTAKNPMAIQSVQGAFSRAKFAAGINKRRVSIHTLRHCYATHLLEAGVNPRIIQRYMDHSQLQTTMVYFHLNCGKPTGTSTARLSELASTASDTLLPTSSKWPSPTAASSKWKTVPSSSATKNHTANAGGPWPLK